MSFLGFIAAATLYLTLVVLFISVAVLLVSFRFRSQQNQMLYYPEMPPESRENCEDPVALGVPNAERVVVMTADKVRLRGFMLWPTVSSVGAKGGNSSVADTCGSLSSPLVASVGSVPSGGSVESSGESVPAALANAAGGSGSAVHAAAAAHAAPPFVLLYFHGNAGNVGHRLSLAQAFVAHLKCAVMMMDYRGFGLSDDAEPIQEGLELDAQACFDYLWQDHRVPRDRIVVMGTSLGGAVAIHLAAHDKYARRVLAVIVENTFTSVGDMASALGRPILTKLVSQCPGLAIGVFEYYIKPLALRIGWRSVQKVRRVKAPMLFLSGAQDELVPPEQMRALYKESTQCLRDSNNVDLAVPLRRFQEFEGGMHNNLPLMPGYMGVIQQFMQDVNRSRFSDIV